MPPRPPTSGEIAPGQLFGGRYHIEKQLGKGGMGAVFLARQEPLSRLVAIKVLHGTADEVVVARFQREARLIAQLQHPHIVGLIDFGEDSGRLYLVMEYIDGEPLTALLKREAPLSPRRACDIAIKVAEALAVAHDLNVVHRDVKPDNIMVLRSAGGQDFVKMLDFGVAKIKRDGEAQNTIETKAGLIVGSLRYISPEQVESGEITPRTDLYSFGCILYEMVAGRRVFDYPSPADCAIAHLTEAPKPPTVNGRAIRGPFVDFIMRCLEKKPSRRPADAREALKALISFRDSPAEVDADIPGGQTLRAVDGDLDVAQGARTIEARPVTVPAHSAVARPEMPPIVREVTPQAPLQVEAAPRMPDVELRPMRGGKADHTSPKLPSSFEGRLQADLVPRQAPPMPRPSRLWLLVLLALIIVGGAVAVVLVMSGRPSVDEVPRNSPDTSSPATHDVTEARSDTSAPPDIALERISSDAAVTPEVKAADATSESSAADVRSDIEATSQAVDPALAAGTRLMTIPEGATVLREGRPTCVTPCVLSWSTDEKPPLVRLSLKGYVDIDVQLVPGDRGTEQRFPMSLRTP